MRHVTEESVVYATTDTLTHASLPCWGWSSSRGWPPTQINWFSFKGSTKSGLKIAEVTVIIVAMLQGVSPETHVKAAVKVTEVAEVT